MVPSKEGVTVREFVALCAGHPDPSVQHISVEACRSFLDRCCEIGFLERRDDWLTGSRYYPTAALADWVELVEEGR
jgi:hypothetical protein